MGRFGVDADLLAHEPGVFVDLPFASQRRLRVEDAVVSGAEVTSASGGFGVLAAGDVVVLGREPGQWTAYAVDDVADDHALTLTSAAVGLGDDDATVMEARTFAPQAELVHEELLRAVGVDPSDDAVGLDAKAVKSVTVMRRLEALGTLSRAYAAGVGVVGSAGDERALEKKAERYLRAFSRELRGARVLVDTDGDGRADVWRTPGVAMLVRR